VTLDYCKVANFFLKLAGCGEVFAFDLLEEELCKIGGGGITVSDLVPRNKTCDLRRSTDDG
jgi:hypothetical protein